MSVDKRQTTDDRRQTTDDRRQTTDDRRQTTDDIKTTDDRRQTTDDRRHKKDKRQTTDAHTQKKHIRNSKVRNVGIGREAQGSAGMTWIMQPMQPSSLDALLGPTHGRWVVIMHCRSSDTDTHTRAHTHARTHARTRNSKVSNPSFEKFSEKAQWTWVSLVCGPFITISSSQRAQGNEGPHVLTLRLVVCLEAPPIRVAESNDDRM